MPSFHCMATTLDPARPSPGAGEYPLDPGHFDEAFATSGTARPPYAAVLDALARHDLAVLRERVPPLSDAVRGQPWISQFEVPFGKPQRLRRAFVLRQLIRARGLRTPPLCG